MKLILPLLYALIALLAASPVANAQKKKAGEPKPSESEDAYYKLLTLPIPEGEVL